MQSALLVTLRDQRRYPAVAEQRLHIAEDEESEMEDLPEEESWEGIGRDQRTGMLFCRRHGCRSGATFFMVSLCKVPRTLSFDEEAKVDTVDGYFIWFFILHLISVEYAWREPVRRVKNVAKQKYPSEGFVLHLCNTTAFMLMEKCYIIEVPLLATFEYTSQTIARLVLACDKKNQK